MSMVECAKQYSLRNLQTGEEVLLTGIVRIGRVSNNTIVLDDEKVSRNHATIWESDQQLYIRDEGSTNGTLVNGAPITQSVLLEPESQIQIGNTAFVVAIRSVAPSSDAVLVHAPASGKAFPWIPVSIISGVLLLTLIALFLRPAENKTGRLPTITPSPEMIVMATAVVTPTQTPAPQNTPTPTVPVAVTPVVASPTAGIVYAAPALVAPANGSSHVGSPGPLLSWSSQGDLSGDVYYRIVIDYPHEGKTWREVGWSQTSSWRAPDYLPLLISGPNDCRWSVQVMRVTKRDTSGQPLEGQSLSPVSETWEFIWTTDVAAPTSMPSLPSTPTIEPRP